MKDVTHNFCQTPGVLVLLETPLQLESVAEALGCLPWVTHRIEIENRHTGEYLKDPSALSAAA